MKAVVQRVESASVTVKGVLVGSIDTGFLVLLGVRNGDKVADALYLARKVANLRVFEDASGKMNLSLKEVSGAILSVSQFTLYGDASGGNRPSFTDAAPGETAQPLFDEFNKALVEKYTIKVETGIFGSDMRIKLVNSGPVTIIIESGK
jgi:D-aminoacyl-tRNA deacylase